jgi:hypothetical protein
VIGAVNRQVTLNTACFSLIGIIAAMYSSDLFPLNLNIRTCGDEQPHVYGIFLPAFQAGFYDMLRFISLGFPISPHATLI